MFGKIAFGKILFGKTSALVAVAVAFLATAGSAEAVESPFAQMSGAWSGGGAITLASGVKEQIRCRANYDVMRSLVGFLVEECCAEGVCPPAKSRSDAA